mgnify:CR=1 FL=1
MSAKNQTQVMIDGKLLTVSDYESEEYIQRVSMYVNGKLSEFKKIDGYRRQSEDMKNILMQLNIADDYFKAKKQVEILEDHIAARDKEIFDLKHNLMDMQRRLDELKKK